MDSARYSSGLHHVKLAIDSLDGSLFINALIVALAIAFNLR